MARRTKHVKHEDALGQTCSALLNRLVRTRTLDGVGRAVKDGGPYPIYMPFALREVFLGD